ncbi:MAG: HlyD family secretion protein [Pseudorhodoplanes sp.]|nr:HlyD family secretion protein [Pseudorhodoplanes sp.]
MRRLAIFAVLAAAAIGAVVYFYPGGAPAENAYRLARADRGDIVASVSATGTINPTTTVIVGSQLSGQVVEILADYNSNVKAGQVVARINSDQIRAKLDAARADLEQMRANRMVQEGLIEKVRADTEKARAALADMEAQVARNEALHGDAEKIFQRQSDLRARGFAAEAAVDTARATRDAQAASLNSSKAQVNSAKAAIMSLGADLRVAEANLAAVTAQIAQRSAAVRQIEVDLRNSEIKSPVNGVVIQRNVELGQTVAASLQAPELFRIAEDLRQMEIAANIDESDVGRIRPGQRTTFTVNAYPGRTFEGRVKQVRLGSQTVQNVVIYTAIISVENPRLELLPGMTANLRIETDRRENVVRIPNAALRWRPPALAPEAPAPAAPALAQGPDTAAARPVRLTEIVEALTAEVSLTPDQLKQIESAVGGLRGVFTSGIGTSGDPAALRERARNARQNADDRIAGILTPEQRATFEAIRKRLAEGGGRNAQIGRVFVVGGDGRPQGVTVRIGATDGGNSEILSGLDADAEVIIGGGPKLETQRGPRIGF